MIKLSVIDRVRRETDIVALIGSYVALNKVGRYYRGLCPFHSERNPSFYVSPERQIYRCFGCGAGGSAISFVMAFEKLDFPEAVRFLAKRLGIKVEEDENGGKNRPLYDACERVAGFYERMLAKSAAAQQYLEKRGLSKSVIQRFRIGYAPHGNSLRGNLQKMGLNEQLLVNVGLLIQRDDGLIDYFRDRIIFPIFSVSGKVIGFGGRVLDDSEPKYLNSPDSPIFRKGDSLYGIFQAKAYIREQPPILVEGNFDLLSLVNQGFNNCVAPLGTALTQGQVELVRRYNRQIILCFDGDEAGQKACRRSLAIFLRAGVDPLVVVLPPGEDPDSFVRKNGREGFLSLIQQAMDFVQFFIKDRSLDSVMERRLVIGELSELINLIPDRVTQELYAQQVASIFNIKSQSVLDGNSGAATRMVSTGAPAAKLVRIERILGAAVRDQKLAVIAKRFNLSEMIEHETLNAIAGLVERYCEVDSYTPSLLIDVADDEAARRKITQMLFCDERLPNAEEFQRQLCLFRAWWLQHKIEMAYRSGEVELAEALSREKERILRGSKTVVEKEGRNG